MKRWGPLLLLVLVWGAVFAIPRTRDHARWTYEKCTSDGLLIDNSVFGDMGRQMWFWRDRTALYQRLLIQHPNDKNLHTAIALERAKPSDPKPLEQLAKKYPADPLPLAIELRDCFTSVSDGRMDGPLTNPNYPGKPPAGKALTAADKVSFREAIRVARRGQRLDPNNTYFDWYLIYSLLALRRDKEAMDALAVAARKTGFNDYGYADELARYNARSLERAQSPAEGSVLAATTSFGFMARARQMARLVMEQAIAARRRGDKAAAVQYGYDLLRLSRPMRLQSQTLIGVLVAEALEGIAMLAVQAPPTGVRRKRVATLSRTDNLAGLAASIGERKIAAEVMNEWGTVQKWRAVKWRFLDVESGLLPSVWFGFRLLDQATGFVFAATRWMLGLWLILVAGSFLLRRRISGGGMIASRAAVWGGIAGLLALAATLGTDIAVEMRGENNLGGPMTDYLGASGLTQYASWWIAGFPVFFVVWGALVLVNRWQRAQVPAQPAGSHELGAMGADNAANVVLQRFFPVVAKWSVALAVLGGLVGYFGFLPLNEENFRYSSYLLTFLGAGLWLSLIFAMLRRPRRRETFGMALVAVRSAVGGYLLVIWFCVGLALLAALPGLREFDTQFQRTLREGEMVQLRAMVGL